MEDRHSPSRGPVRFVLFFLALVGLGMLLVPFILVPPASLEIRFRGEEFYGILEGKTANVTDESGHTRSVPIYKYPEGMIADLGRVPSGERKWMVEVEYFRSAHFTATVEPLKKKRVSVSLTPAFGRLRVRGMNVLKPDEPVRTALSITIGGKTYKGEPGRAVFIPFLSPGEHELKAEAPEHYGFTGKVKIAVGDVKDVNVYLSPTLSDHESARIVLRWGEDPRDLDSHLLLPEKLNIDHVYYPGSNKRAEKDGEIAAMLDVDDTTSYGPETVTIYDRLSGVYTYAVYFYAGSGTLGMSDAEVEVYLKSGEIKKFKVPAYCQKRWWHVFDLDINGTDVRVVEKNTCREKMNMMPGKKSDDNEEED